MGLSDKKQETKQASTQSGQATNTYGYQTPPTTPDLDRLRDQQFEVDPGLSAQYGRQRRELESSFNQPTGAFYPPQVRDAILRSGRERLGQQEAEAMRGGQFDKNKLDFARNSTVAGMTAPVLTQTGSQTSGTSTGNSTVTQSENPTGAIVKTAASLAPMSL